MNPPRLFAIAPLAILIFILTVTWTDSPADVRRSVSVNLPPGQHLGYIEGFNPDNPPELRAIMDDAWRDARAAGMTTRRVQMDWPDVEPEEGMFLENELRERLELEGANEMPVFLLLSTADSDALNYPGDLLNEDGDGFAGGMRPNDPTMIARYTTMLERAAPILREYNVYLVSIGNEPDTWHEHDPNFVADFIDFVKAVRDFSEARELGFLITYTATTTAIVQPEVGYGHLIPGAVDVMCFNFYAYANSQGLDFALIEATLEGILDLAGDKPIVFQEWGASSRYLIDPAFNFYESSWETQRQFFAWFLERLQDWPQIRAVYLFQLVENSPLIDQFYYDSFDGELPEDIIERIVLSFKGLGVIDYETHEIKPAWSEFLAGMEAFHHSGPAANSWVLY